MKKVLIHRLDTNMAELRNFGCCFDNFKASKIIHIVFLVVDGIMVITGPILFIALVWVCIKKYLFVLIHVFSFSFTHLGLQGSGLYSSLHWLNCRHHLCDLHDHWRFVACRIHQAKQSCIDGWVNFEWNCHSWIGSPNSNEYLWNFLCVCDTFNAPHHWTQIVDFLDRRSMLSLYWSWYIATVRVAWK